MDLNTGLPDGARREIAEHLSHMLADTYTLYLKTHGYHWNVSGPMFRSLHLMFEEQYMDLRDAADLIAERMLALGHLAPRATRSTASSQASPMNRGCPKRWTWSATSSTATRPS